MPFRNIGIFYMIEPLFEELRRVFPSAQIATTMQFSSAFCKKFNIISLPMSLYYDFSSTSNLEMAQKEYNLACNLYNKRLGLNSTF